MEQCVKDIENNITFKVVKLAADYCQKTDTDIEETLKFIIKDLKRVLSAKGFNS